MRRFLLAATLSFAPVMAAHADTVWTFDNLKEIGDLTPHVQGQPKIVSTPQGKAVALDGVGDALTLDANPLAGAKTYTIEAIFRPDGGAFEQRWLHVAQTDPKTGLNVTPGTDTTPRFLMEIRVVKNQWYLDAFANGTSGSAVLAFPQKLHPVGPWYQVAQVYDGKMLRSYVNGELQGEAPLPNFVAPGEGRTSIGVRLNRVNYFHGAVRQARFTLHALSPEQFLKAPR